MTGLRLFGRGLFYGLCPAPGAARSPLPASPKRSRLLPLFRLTFFRTHVSDVPSVNRHFYLLTAF
ncbi:hypothetical protein DESPIG_02417 [Desulfovibrio piger ATCC 29098]|uniref:Uncharacterized protein n=1 Tax=Desulfovibrio piger ATCC 29098 TaxID=411464 RepID=B6WWE9_9BACT|nr:hypothetical protein DESPIG_02417 [Desulfovibrio piger ATCC 29098]